MTLWSGRFREPPDDVLWRFTVDPSDRRMLVDDIVGSIAHVEMLGDVGLLTTNEVEEITGGLERIKAEAAGDSFEYAAGDEDIHSAVERRLGELIGPLAGKLHTGRSRNDQVALDVRLYLRRMTGMRLEQIRAFALVMAELADANIEVVVPSFTHMQQAQPVPLAHHLLAYAWMLLRDAERFEGVARRLDVSPLGASAGGGTSLPLDTKQSARRLGMSAAFENSMDAVASRDVVTEYAFCCAQAMVHLSRLAEELVLWASQEFGWVTLADRYTTGSSAMPQKKNPDMAELVRGRAAPAIGHLTTLLALQKGAPMTYNRDFQEDKSAVFAADDLLAGSLEAVTAMLATADFHPPPPGSWVAALDLAEALVERGVPFREAHEIVGRLVKRLIGGGRELAEVTVDDLAAIDERLEEADLSRLDPEDSVRRRSSGGGASFDSVRAQVEEIRRRLSSR